MINKKESSVNFANYLRDGLLVKKHDENAKQAYIQNAELSLKVANELMNSELKPYLWVVVCSYYSMFYMANAILCELGYKTGDKIVHKVTYDALIVLVLDKLKKGMLENYEELQNDAMEIASFKAEEIIRNYELELGKRSTFQYNMLETTKQQKALTSLKRASEFLFEMKKIGE